MEQAKKVVEQDQQHPPFQLAFVVVMCFSASCINQMLMQLMNQKGRTFFKSAAQIKLKYDLCAR